MDGRLESGERECGGEKSGHPFGVGMRIVVRGRAVWVMRLLKQKLCAVFRRENGVEGLMLMVADCGWGLSSRLF